MHLIADAIESTKSDIFASLVLVGFFLNNANGQQRRKSSPMGYGKFEHLIINILVGVAYLVAFCQQSCIPKYSNIQTPHKTQNSWT